jgi:uncharacterized membrane protein YqiK
MNDTNSTTNAILVVLLVIVVGFIVWFMMGRRIATEPAAGTPNIEVNLPGGTSGTGGTQ